MDYKRRRHWQGKNNRKGRARPKLALAGAILLAVGILLIFYVADVRNFDSITGIGGICILAGTLMLIFSMSRRNQKRFVKGIDTAREAFKDQCQCCKCQNCGRNHNHWTHDDDDTRRRH